jgi:hypothetical protein
VDVLETLRVKNKQQKDRVFKIIFRFLSPERYQEDKMLTPHQILHYMENR